MLNYTFNDYVNKNNKYDKSKLWKRYYTDIVLKGGYVPLLNRFNNKPNTLNKWLHFEKSNLFKGGNNPFFCNSKIVFINSKFEDINKINIKEDLLIGILISQNNIIGKVLYFNVKYNINDFRIDELKNKLEIKIKDLKLNQIFIIENNFSDTFIQKINNDIKKWFIINKFKISAYLEHQCKDKKINKCIQKINNTFLDQNIDLCKKLLHQRIEPITIPNQTKLTCPSSIKEATENINIINPLKYKDILAKSNRNNDIKQDKKIDSDSDSDSDSDKRDNLIKENVEHKKGELKLDKIKALDMANIIKENISTKLNTFSDNIKTEIKDDIGELSDNVQQNIDSQFDDLSTNLTSSITHNISDNLSSQLSNLNNNISKKFSDLSSDITYMNSNYTDSYKFSNDDEIYDDKIHNIKNIKNDNNKSIKSNVKKIPLTKSSDSFLTVYNVNDTPKNISDTKKFHSKLDNIITNNSKEDNSYFNDNNYKSLLRNPSSVLSDDSQISEEYKTPLEFIEYFTTSKLFNTNYPDINKRDVFKNNKYNPIYFTVSEIPLDLNKKFNPSFHECITKPNYLKGLNNWADPIDINLIPSNSKNIKKSFPWNTSYCSKNDLLKIPILERKSLVGPIQFYKKYPLYPYGKTGIMGRGCFPKWGPNICIGILVIYKKNHNWNVILEEECIIPMHLLLNKNINKDNEPHLLKEIFIHFIDNLKDYDINRLIKKCNIVQPNSHSKKSSSNKIVLIDIIDRAFKDPVLIENIFKGIYDSNKNTDNAWLETSIYILNLDLHNKPKLLTINEWKLLLTLYTHSIKNNSKLISRNIIDISCNNKFFKMLKYYIKQYEKSILPKLNENYSKEVDKINKFYRKLNKSVYKIKNETRNFLDKDITKPKVEYIQNKLKCNQKGYFDNKVICDKISSKTIDKMYDHKWIDSDSFIFKNDSNK